MRLISIIVAISENLAIGRDNRLLFHLPGDLPRFKRITLGHPVVMGRNTLLSLPRWPLPGRRNIVITDRADDHFPGCEMAGSVGEALAATLGEQEIFIIGGGSVYRQFFPLAGRLYLTVVHAHADGDTFFPEIDYAAWNESDREDHFDPESGLAYSYLVLDRRPAPVGEKAKL